MEPIRRNIVQNIKKKLAIVDKARLGSDTRIKAVRGIFLFLLRNQKDIFALRLMKLMITTYGKAFYLKRSILQKASRIIDNNDNNDNTVDKTLKYYAMVIKNLDKWSKTIHKKLLDEMVAQYHMLPSNLPMDLKSYVVGFITPKGVFH
jgi:hypothetical protein